MLCNTIPPEGKDSIQSFESYSFSKNFRLEPVSRAPGLGEGIGASTADPLWMLARQWQSGEFKGENAGSPIWVEVDCSAHSLYTPPSGSQTANDVTSQPLEKWVEEEYREIDWRTSVRIGQQFEKLLGLHLIPLDKVLPYYRNEAFPVTLPTTPADLAKLDYDSRQFIEFMQGKVVNGRVLFEQKEALKNQFLVWNGQGPNRPKLMPPDVSISFEEIKKALMLAIKDLGDWCEKHGILPRPQPPKAWRNEQLDYRFQIGSKESNGRELVAPAYQNGNLEWYQFNADPALPNAKWTARPTIKGVPSRLKIRGTAYRWWEFEDAAVDFGHLENVREPDLAKLNLMEFVMIYGDDWYNLTIPMEMGNLVRIDQVRIKNVFGETFGQDPNTNYDGLIPAQVLDDEPMKRWEVFTLSPIPGGQPALSAPHAAGIEVFDRAKYRPLANAHAQIVGQLQSKTLEPAKRTQLKTQYQTIAQQIQALEQAKKSILFIPPVAGFREESAPLEEIRFLRDEGANMLWAVENTLTNGLGYPVGGFELHRERAEREHASAIKIIKGNIEKLKKELDKPGISAQLREKKKQDVLALELNLRDLENHKPVPGVPMYRLATSVPDNWIPFIPVNAEKKLGYFGIRLRRAMMLRNEKDQDATPIPAMSTLLGPDDEQKYPNSLLWLEEATVPRSGRRLQLTAQRLRWVDGKTYTWYGRKVLTGKGEGSSGLKFDILSAAMKP